MRGAPPPLPSPVTACPFLVDEAIALLAIADPMRCPAVRPVECSAPRIDGPRPRKYLVDGSRHRVRGRQRVVDRVPAEPAVRFLSPNLRLEAATRAALELGLVGPACSHQAAPLGRSTISSRRDLGHLAAPGSTGSRSRTRRQRRSRIAFGLTPCRSSIWRISPARGTGALMPATSLAWSRAQV